MVISRAKISQQIRNGSVKKKKRKLLKLLPGAKRRPKNLTRLMRKAGREK